MSSREKILIVDDNPINIRILTEILEEDYDTKGAQSGEEAIEMAPQYAPDMVLLDIMMPGKNGYEVCRELRRNTALSQTKIIMISAKAMVADRLEGYEAGADDYITKPFDEDELLAKIRIYLKLKTVEEVEQIKGNLLALLRLQTITPLNNILCPVDRLIKNINSDAQTSIGLLKTIQSSARQLENLFDNILVLSALKSEELDFEFEKVDLSAAIKNVITDLEPQANERDIVISVQLIDAPLAEVDVKHIKRVVTTIMDNAIRFSPPHGRVTIQLTADANHYYLHITDSGSGVRM